MNIVYYIYRKVVGGRVNFFIYFVLPIRKKKKEALFLMCWDCKLCCLVCLKILLNLYKKERKFTIVFFFIKIVVLFLKRSML